MQRSVLILQTKTAKQPRDKQQVRIQGRAGECTQICEYDLRIQKWRISLPYCCTHSLELNSVVEIAGSRISRFQTLQQDGRPYADNKRISL